MDGDVDSGAMITARYAMAQGRPVFTVPCSIYAPGSRGPHSLPAAGARALSAADGLAETLGLPPEVLRCPPLRSAQPEARRAEAALAVLEVRGLVRQCPGKNFVRRPRPQRGADAVPTDAGGTTWPNRSSS